LIDVTELAPDERQKLMWTMPLYALKDVLNKLMKDNRVSEVPARLDALTIYTIRK
jgi:hypothetical protein